MKKKIIVSLSIFTLLFLFGGIYIISSIESATSKLDNLIFMHQVGILREHLLIQIKSVQSDLNLKNTRYANSIDSVISNVANMERMVNSCFECHHSIDIENKLNKMEEDIHKYQKGISKLFTIRANEKRLRVEEDSTYKIGSQIESNINDMITISSYKLEDMTITSIQEISDTKNILFLLVALGPISTSILAFFLINGINRPLSSLQKATRKLKEGKMDFVITGLKDEFGDVANSFNEMTFALNKSMLEIRESEKKYRNLFESAGEGIYMLKAEGEDAGKIFSANKASADMHGYTVDELQKLNIINDIDTPESAAKAPALLKRVLNGEWINVEGTHHKKDGTVFPVEISAGLMEYMGYKYILAFNRDITERKRVDQSLQRAEQLKKVGEWAAGLAHEIKNPLAGIKISVEVLAEEMETSKEAQSIINRVIDEIKRIEFLIKSLLIFAKPSEPQLEMTDINEVLGNCIAFSLEHPSTTSGDQHNILVSKQFAPELPEILIDPYHLRQAFLNLLLNAIDAVGKGGTVTVKTLYNADINSVQIKISDTGKGIEKDKLDKIFQPFFTTKSKGTGLGLAITKRLIEQYNGTISVDSELNEGTTFHVILPVSTDAREML